MPCINCNKCIGFGHNCIKPEDFMYVALNTAGSLGTVILGVFFTEQEARDALWKYFKLQKNADSFLESIRLSFLRSVERPLTDEELKYGIIDLKGADHLERKYWETISDDNAEFFCLEVEYVKKGTSFNFANYTWPDRFDLANNLYHTVDAIYLGKMFAADIEYVARELPLFLPKIAEIAGEQSEVLESPTK